VDAATSRVRWTMTGEVHERLKTQASNTRPRECCGLLLGRPGQVVAARPAANLAESPDRFELDPQAHVAAIRETRGSDIGVVGFYHSHPHSAPIPSERDLAESTYPEALHVIIGSPTGSELEIRGYYLREGGYEGVELLKIED
jgi:proteasome lid subunit RPN8/RPN11